MRADSSASACCSRSRSDSLRAGAGADAEAEAEAPPDAACAAAAVRMACTPFIPGFLAEGDSGISFLGAESGAAAGLGCGSFALAVAAAKLQAMMAIRGRMNVQK
jgi:hypothetical protein